MTDTERPGEIVEQRQLCRVGYAYREPAQSGDNEWHLTREKPAPRKGREIRSVYLGPSGAGILWPSHPSDSSRTTDNESGVSLSDEERPTRDLSGPQSGRHSAGGEA